jgi:CheY-like chemotaxis protein
MLHSLGHQVDLAGDGQAGLAALQEADYDVVLMDIHMPVMDGIEATRAIRVLIPAQRQPHIVAMTAGALPDERRAAAAAGMDGFLLKPVRLADLAQALVPPAAVDLGLFEQVCDESGAHTVAARSALVRAYLEQGESWMVELAGAAARTDSPQLGRIVHSLGSSSALIGATRLAQRLQALRVPDPDAADLSAAITSVIVEYRRVAATLRRYLPEPRNP